jgi:hypothetical protein
MIIFEGNTVRLDNNSINDLEIALKVQDLEGFIVKHINLQERFYVLSTEHILHEGCILSVISNWVYFKDKNLKKYAETSRLSC